MGSRNPILRPVRYVGDPFTGRVTVEPLKRGGERRLLLLRHELRNHARTFSWGYRGEGPAQLALAILADAIGNDQRAVRLYQLFKNEVIAGLQPEQPWSLSHYAVVAWVRQAERALSPAPASAVRQQQARLGR